MKTFSIIKKSQLESAMRIDAEYYQQTFLDNIEKIKKYGCDELQKLSIIDITKGETPLWRGDDYLKQGVPFLRSENLISTGLDISNIVFISEKVNKRMKRSIIYPNDILLAIVGATIGKIGLATSDYDKYNTNQAIAIVRPKNKELSNFLSIILETKFCQLQIDRLKGGGARDNLDLHEVKVIKIPKPNTLIDYCNDIVNKIQELQKQNIFLYKQAEKILIEELELKGFNNEEKMLSIVNLSDTEYVHRIDAEYFQPKYKIIEDKIKKYNAKRLGDLVSIKKGIEVGAEEYQEEGKIFIRVSSMTKFGIVESDQKYLSEKLYEKLKKDFEPKKGEILLTKDATPGIAYVLKHDIRGIISGGTLRLKLKDNEVEGEYLALCLNSFLGQMQAERDAGGSVIAHWKPEQIKNVLIPILPKEIQEKISNLVKQSFEARKKSKELLEEAKRKVEEMIEK